ncbi:hypothetical protein SNE40_009395 [Patella caerulea]|uniref:Uncharacterized protein n=1 Tax=Patella caerulea TaxID=87958 RepID=A0AAN8JR61_PATCE
MASKKGGCSLNPSTKHKKEDTEDMELLSLQQKLDLIDDELHKLHMFCINSGYNPSQIEQFAEPLSKKVKEANRKKWLKLSMKSCLFLCASWFLFSTDPGNKLICTIGRRAAIQIMPIYDWSQLYYVDCLLENPLHESQMNPVLKDCYACENQNEISRVKNIKEEDLIQKYIKLDKPVIVEDGLSQNDHQEFTVEFLAKIFENSMYDSCDFNCNVKVSGHRSFLKQVAAHEHPQYFAFWKNCFEDSARELRYYFKKPYFLSSVVEVSETSWIYISKNYTAKKPKPILVDGPMVILMQMVGTVDVVLFPDKVCEDVCPELRETLHGGEILLVNDFLWIIDYYPNGESESIGIGLTGSFD